MTKEQDMKIYSTGLDADHVKGSRSYDGTFLNPTYVPNTDRNGVEHPYATVEILYEKNVQPTRIMPRNVRRVLVAQGMQPETPQTEAEKKIGAVITPNDVAHLDGIPAKVYFNGREYHGWSVDPTIRKAKPQINPEQ